MNRLIIRVCEIALSSLTELQMQNEKKLRKSLEDMANPKTPTMQTATAINVEAYENEKANRIIEERKKVVKELMDIAYRKDI